MEETKIYEGKEKGPEIVVSFSLNNEVFRVNDTLKKLPWYKEHYGKSNSRLPEGVDEKTNTKDVASAVSAEFTEDDYKDYSQYIQENWSNVSGGLEKLKEMLAFHLLDTYSVHLTKYGSGGSYNAERGTVLVNIVFQSKDRVVGTIIHEIVHIGIEHLIGEYNVKHWYKERLVDLLVEYYFPAMRKMQNIKENTMEVDKAFNNFFPDIEAVVKTIGEEK